MSLKYEPSSEPLHISGGWHLDWRRAHNVEAMLMCSGSQAGSYLRLIDFCITQLKAQGPSRTCNESKEEEEEETPPPPGRAPFWVEG